MSEQQPPPEPRVGGTITLAGGRIVGIEIPVPFSPIEALQLIAALPDALAQFNAAAARPVAGRITLPDGRLRSVPRVP